MSSFESAAREGAAPTKGYGRPLFLLHVCLRASGVRADHLCVCAGVILPVFCFGTFGGHFPDRRTS